jgi:hypothetical protein
MASWHSEYFKLKEIRKKKAQKKENLTFLCPFILQWTIATIILLTSVFLMQAINPGTVTL